MELSIQFIIDWFRKKDWPVQFNTEISKPILRTVRWMIDENISPEALYVVPSSADSADDEGTIVTYESGVLYLREDPKTIFNEISNIFQYYNELEEELLQCAFMPDALEKIAAIGLKLFGCSVAIVGEDNEVIAQARGSEDNLESCLRRADRDEIIECEFDDYFFENFFNDMPDDGNTRYILKTTIWNTNQKFGQVYLYRLRGRIHAGLIHMFYRYVQVIESNVALNPEKGSGISCLKNEFKALLDGENGDSEKFFRYLQGNGWFPQHRYAFVVIMTKSDRAAEKYAAIIDGIRGASTDNLYLEYDEKLVLLCNCSLDINAEENARNSLQDFIYEVHMGISYRFSGFDRFRDYYMQAEYAALCAFEESKPCLTAFDVTLRYIKKHISNKYPEMKLLIHPDFTALFNYDRDNGTDYARSFAALLENGFDYQAAGGLLSVHPNTLRYRLKKIEEIISGNIYDMEYRKKIFPSLMLFDPEKI